MINILYFSKNISSSIIDDYVSASYQQDFINKLSDTSNLKHYGPGYANYNENDQYEDVLKKIDSNPDIVIFGHNWLSDKATDVEISIMPLLDINKIKIPKVIILNKEYVNLKRKLKYIKENKFDLMFSHHHDVNIYSEIANTKCKFLPFACNERFLTESKQTKSIDVFFSGVLKNLNKDANQSNFRINCQKRIFYTIFDEQIKKRKEFYKYNIVWNTVPRFLIGKIIKKIKGHRLFSYDDYAKMIKSSKIILSSLSPMGLISPRYFEAMISRSLVFTEKSELFSNVFDKKFITTIKDDATDLHEKVEFYLNNSKKFEEQTEKAHNYVKENHTWSNRVQSFNREISKI